MPQPLLIETPIALRNYLGDHRPAFVPTRGGLHPGHQALIGRAANAHPLVVVGIWLDRAQTTDTATFDAWPRSIDRDCGLAGEAGAGVVFAPTSAAMRPVGFATSVDPGPLAEMGDGAVINTAFATMSARLLGMVRPAATYAGERDLVRLRLLERIAADLQLSGSIVACPVARDVDGLPWATVSAGLTLGQRRTAAALPRALMLLRDMAAAGERSCAALLAEAIAILGREPALEVDALTIVDGRTLAPRDELQPGDYALARIRVGGVALADVLQLLPPRD